MTTAADTPLTVTNLTAAIARLDRSNLSATGIVSQYLDDLSYDIATRVSENLNAVGLTGLCEDISRGDADRSDLRDVLVVALAEANHRA